MDNRKRCGNLAASTATLQRWHAYPAREVLSGDTPSDYSQADAHAALHFSVALPSRRWLAQATDGMS